MNLIVEHESIILGNALEGKHTPLREVLSLGYKFSNEKYIQIAQYVFEEGLKGNVNRAEFKNRFGIEDAQLEFMVLQGQQNPEPSKKYLIENALTDAKRIALKRMLNKPVEEWDKLLFEELEMRLKSLKPLREFKKQVDIDLSIAEFMDSIQNNRSKIYKTPFAAWNKSITGISCEDLIVIGAYSGHGKTHTAIQISMEVLKQNGRVCFITGENSEEEIKTRFGAHQAKTFESYIYQPNTDECMRLADGISDVTSLYGDNLTIIREMNFDEIFTIMEARASADMDDFYVLDYIQLFDTKKRYSSERERLMDFARQLVDFIGKHKKPVLVLSQLVQNQTDSFKGAQDLLNMATVACWITRSKSLIEASDLGSKDHYKVIMQFKKVRRGMPFTVFGCVYPQNPAIIEVAESVDKQAWFDLLDQFKNR